MAGGYKGLKRVTRGYRIRIKDKCFIINRAPTDTCVYNDNKDFRAIITDVYICKIYTTIKQGYI